MDGGNEEDRKRRREEEDTAAGGTPKGNRVRTKAKTVLSLSSSQLKHCWLQLRGLGVQSTCHIRSHTRAVAGRWKALEDFPVDECVICDYACGSSGYPEMKVAGAAMHGVRHIVLRLFKPDLIPGPCDDASHFWCNEKKCINPRHLTYEDHDHNVSRFCCKLFAGQYVDYKCPHTPSCRGCNPCTQ